MDTRHALAVLAACCALTGTFDSAIAYPGKDCEWCGAHEAPAELDSETTLAGPDEPGRRLTLTGTVYEPDGETPAPGVLLYVYHTNAAGKYEPKGEVTGNERRHGHLRGWVVSDADGRYTVHTIRPGSYPGRDTPAHIHMTVKEPGRAEYWIDSVLFEDDPKLNREKRENQDGRGGPGIVEPSEQANGSLLARRDVILMPDEDE